MDAGAVPLADLFEFLVRLEPFGFERVEARVHVCLTADRPRQFALLLRFVTRGIGDECIERRFLRVECVHFLFDLRDAALQRLLQMRELLPRFRFEAALFLAIDVAVATRRAVGRWVRRTGSIGLQRGALLGRMDLGQAILK